MNGTDDDQFDSPWSGAWLVACIAIVSAIGTVVMVVAR